MACDYLYLHQVHQLNVLLVQGLILLFQHTVHCWMKPSFWTWDRKGVVCPTFIEDTDVIEESNEPLDKLLYSHNGLRDIM